MPPPIQVVLAAFNPGWRPEAARHAETLRGLGPVVLCVHHIGSTAVPGLAAKPIIDLMPLVRSLAALDRARTRIEALGYIWHGAYGIPGRRYCTLADDAGVRAVQLHCFRADSPHAVRHLAFRDYLRAFPEAACAYDAEKRRAWALHPDDSHAYGAEKSSWIRATEAISLAWYAARSIGARGCNGPIVECPATTRRGCGGVNRLLTFPRQNRKAGGNVPAGQSPGGKR